MRCTVKIQGFCGSGGRVACLSVGRLGNRLGSHSLHTEVVTKGCPRCIYLYVFVNVRKQSDICKSCMNVCVIE